VRIGLMVIATNAYLPLGIRLIKKFNHFYTGKASVHFYLATEDDPFRYLNCDNVTHITRQHKTWAEGTDTKFKEIVGLANEQLDYVFALDADTNIDKPFDEEWFIGTRVGFEHFGNKTWMLKEKNYDRNPKSNAYVPHDTPLPQMYYMGMIFGGELGFAVDMCTTMMNWRDEDYRTGNPAAVQDESYVNKFFHVNPPDKVVLYDDFKWVVSDKGGIGADSTMGIRNLSIDISKYKRQMARHKDELIEIANSKLTPFDVLGLRGRPHP
jgi:hypothetical protein